jgi:hypothetical protein
MDIDAGMPAERLKKNHPSIIRPDTADPDI